MMKTIQGKINRRIFNTIFRFVVWYLPVSMLFDINCHAQTLPIIEYDVTDGLTNSQDNEIFQDSRGFFWIINHNRISKFDGIDFVNYSIPDSVLDSPFMDVIEDNSDTVWVCTSKGILFFSGDRIESLPLKVNTGITAISHHTRITFDDSSRLYLVCSNGKNKKGSVYTFRHGIYHEYSSLIPAIDTIDVNSALYIDRSNELLILSSGHRLYSWKENKLKLIGVRIRDIGMSRDQDYIICWRNGKYDLLYDGAGLVPNVVANFSRRSGIIEEKGNDYSVILHGKKAGKVKIKSGLRLQYLDRENCFWISTDLGIARIPNTPFESLDEDDTPIESIWTIVCDQNNHLWLGSLRDGSLVEYDGENFRSRNEYKLKAPENTVFFKGSRLMENGDIWFSMNNGVLIWNGKSFGMLRDLPENCQVCYIYEDQPAGKIILGTDLGLFIISNGKVEFDERFTDAGLGVIEGVTKDKNGFYWLSGHKGILKLKGTNIERSGLKSGPNSGTLTLVTDFRNGIWVTSPTGLYYKPGGSEVFSKGLPPEINTAANSIILMDSLHLLVGRMTDICIIDLGRFYNGKHDYYRIYDRSDGFGGVECLDNGIVRDTKGNFWILTTNKVVKLNKERLKKNTIPPALSFTSLMFRNDNLEWMPVPGLKLFYSVPATIELQSNQNTIKISYSGRSSTNPEKVSYRYFMEGYDEKWSLPAYEREHVFEKLPPGEYTFMLRAANSDGVETENIIKLHLVIKPQIWQTDVFKIAVSLAALAIIILTTRFIIKRIDARKRKLEQLMSEISHMQMRLVMKQFDPHFTFNVISSVGSMILKGNRETAYEYIVKLAGLLRIVLTEGAPLIIPLSDELDFVRKYCELTKLRFKERFTFMINVDDSMDLSMPVPRMLVQSFVENSIKHAYDNLMSGGILEVSVRNSEDNRIIKITDNGKGFNNTSGRRPEGTGQGVRIIRSLFYEMNSRNKSKAELIITDLAEAGKGQGTEISIIIPNDYKFSQNFNAV